MSEYSMWTEKLFKKIMNKPIQPLTQILLRLTFLVLLWVIGAAIYAGEKLLPNYVQAIGIYEGLYIPGFIILCGSYGVQNALKRIMPSFQPLFDMNEGEFKKFTRKAERVIYAFTPCVIIALLFAIFLSGVPGELSRLYMGGFSLRVIWNLISALFFDLLSGTGVWMFLGIWYLIFTVSRQKFRAELLNRAVEEFHELMKLTLYYALFYFITISIAVALPLLSSRSSSWGEVIFSPYLLFVIIGAASVVFPLYSIHDALVKLKKVRLDKLRAESDNLLQQLEHIRADGTDSNQILVLMLGLQAVQVKERYVVAAQEWPVNIDFVGKLAGLIIMPTIVRIFIELFRGYLPL
jgi:hypothetical protein